MAWNKTSAESRGYDWKWKKLRAQVLLRDRYICQISLKKGLVVAATEVDHITSKADWLKKFGNLDGVDHPSNLQSVCHEEHTAKTMAEKGYISRVGGDVNGDSLDPHHPWNRS